MSDTGLKLSVRLYIKHTDRQLPHRNETIDHPSVVELQNRRNSILGQNARLGDFRPGYLAQSHRKGASHCACPGSMGHSPTWTLTIKARNQKSVHHTMPEEALEVTREHIEQNQRFNELIHQLVAVSDTLCQARIRLQQDKTKPQSRRRSKAR